MLKNIRKIELSRLNERQINNNLQYNIIMTLGDVIWQETTIQMNQQNTESRKYLRILYDFLARMDSNMIKCYFKHHHLLYSYTMIILL